MSEIQSETHIFTMLMSNKLNILIAYPYLKKEEVKFLKDNENYVNVLVDSGAFTAWKKGTVILPEDYAEFIKRLPFKPWQYFTLDVIGDAKKSFNNYSLLRKLNLNPIPIFTRGEDVSMIDKYYNEYDYISIGGLVGTNGNKGFVNGIMKHIGKRKVHWLGFTKQEYIHYYKPSSCDSSGWAGGMMFGKLLLYDSAGKFHVINRKILSYKLSDRIIWLLQNIYEIDPKRLQSSFEWENKEGRALRQLTFISAIRYQSDIQNKTGVKYFLASSGAQDMRPLLSTHIKLCGEK